MFVQTKLTTVTGYRLPVTETWPVMSDDEETQNIDIIDIIIWYFLACNLKLAGSGCDAIF